MSDRMMQRVSINKNVRPSANVLIVNFPSRMTRTFKREEDKNGGAVLYHDLVLSESEVRDLCNQGFDLQPGLSAYRVSQKPKAKKKARKPKPEVSEVPVAEDHQSEEEN